MVASVRALVASGGLLLKPELFINATCKNPGFPSRSGGTIPQTFMCLFILCLYVAILSGFWLDNNSEGD